MATYLTPNLPIADALCILQVVIGTLFYRLTLHPLANYPGPILARLTDWVAVYQTLGGDRHHIQLDDHRKYGAYDSHSLYPALDTKLKHTYKGSVVRIGPNTLSFNTIEAVREIYANRQGNVQKAPWYTVIEASAGGASSIHAETDRGIHASHRRVMEHAFTDKSLRASQAYLVQNVQTFRDVILQSSKTGKDWSQPYNMSQWSTYLSYDIMGDLVFGRRFNLMTSDAHRFVPKLIMNSTAFIYTVRISVGFLGSLFKILTSLVVRIHASSSNLTPPALQCHSEPAHYWWPNGHRRQKVLPVR